MNLEYQEYQARKIVNVHKHVDGPWFWNKYSAHPYVGCRSGCEFCYLRSGTYLGRRDPDSFDTLIQIKMNAIELLRKELVKLPKEVISAGDWQEPAEGEYQISRAMLEVILEFGFPLFVVERSDLLMRDLDLLQDIHTSSHVSVVYSISNLDPALKEAFEPHSPGLQRRLNAVKTLATANIPVGITLMPVIPFLGDDVAHLEEVIKAGKDHGARFVIGGGITMDGVQAERTYTAVGRLDPAIEAQWREMYNRKKRKSKPAPSGSYTFELGRKVRELCLKHGIADRMPRYIPKGPLEWNKRLAEKLFLKTYELELDKASNQRVWTYRKAAWIVDEMEESIVDIYKEQGEAGMQNLPTIGRSMAGQMARWLQAHEITATK